MVTGSSKQRVVSLVLAGFLLTATAPAFAFRAVGVTVGLGTVGYGLWAGTPIVPNTLNIRAGFSQWSTTRSGVYSKSGTSLNYSGDLTIGSIPVFLDYFPFHGIFRLTAGVVDNRTHFDIDATPSAGSTVTINGNTYTAAQAGSLAAKYEYNRTFEPYLGLGWGNLASDTHGLTFGMDLGVIFTGSPTVSLTTSNPTNDAALAADVTAAQQTAQTDAHSARYWPVIQFGVGYNF